MAGEEDVRRIWDAAHGAGAFAAMPSGSCTALAGYEVNPESTTAAGWLATWGLRAKDAYDFEPLTSAYQGCTHLKNPHEVLIFERYTSGRQSLQAHFPRPAHRALDQVMTERKLTRKRVLTGVIGEDLWGWSRGTEARVVAQMRSASGAGGPKGTLVFLNVRRFGSEKQLEDWVKIMEEQFQYCWDHEPDTLQYYGGRIVKAGDRGPPVQTGDMFFVMECSNGAAMKLHGDYPGARAMMASYESTTKADPSAKGITYETILEATYRSTEHGFMTKDAQAGWIQPENLRGRL